jgi:hypothetical protein
MKSRKIIEVFCKENDLKIVELKYDRRLDYQYGDGTDDSAWTLQFIPLFIPNAEIDYAEGYTALDLVEELKWVLTDLKGE